MNYDRYKTNLIMYYIFLFQTMSGLVDGMVKLIKAEFGYDLLDALVGFENATRVFNNLLKHSSNILTGKKKNF